jgi:hypothetical protein
MKPQDHVTKARRIEATIVAKLDFDRDYELCLEGYMLAGTHYLNAVLHKRGVTREQFDLSHTDRPRLDAPIDETLRPLFEALRQVEDLRPDYLRGNKTWNAEDGRRCRESYEQVRRLAEKALG